jgi:hypothetical protein
MKNKASLLIALALAALALAPAAAADKKPTKPRANEVVLVARFVVSPTPDRDFFSHYAAFKAPGVEASVDRSLKGKTPDDSVYLETNVPGSNSYYSAVRTRLSSLGELGFVKIQIPKNREIQIDGARVFLVDNGFLFFDLPIMSKIVVPEGANYVYLGTFSYSLANEFFNIASISKSDEFDAALVATQKAYGDGAELVRANLLDLSAPGADKKK